MPESFELALPCEFSAHHGLRRDLLGKVLLELHKAPCLAEPLGMPVQADQEQGGQHRPRHRACHTLRVFGHRHVAQVQAALQLFTGCSVLSLRWLDIQINKFS